MKVGSETKKINKNEIGNPLGESTPYLTRPRQIGTTTGRILYPERQGSEMEMSLSGILNPNDSLYIKPTATNLGRPAISVEIARVREVATKTAEILVNPDELLEAVKAAAIIAKAHDVKKRS